MKGIIIIMLGKKTYGYIAVVISSPGLNCI